MSGIVSFSGNNPGAVRYGNFINYYTFHPPEYRITPILNDICDEGNNLLFLDVGCNSGDLTQMLYKCIFSVKDDMPEPKQPVESQTHTINTHFVGVDMDPVLIERAIETNLHPNNVFYECLDFMSEERDQKLNEIVGKFKKTNFDAVFCYSVTMWIHLNYGDEGLKTFLSALCMWTNCVVIEPQPWKCYVAALRRLKRTGASFPYFDEISLRNNLENDIEIIFQQLHFAKVAESIPSSWSRRTFVYKKMH